MVWNSPRLGQKRALVSTFTSSGRCFGLERQLRQYQPDPMWTSVWTLMVGGNLSDVSD